MNTGGTISSSPGKNGLKPKFTAKDLLDQIPAIKEICEVEYESIMNLESGNIQPETWAFLSETVFRAMDDFDGIVIAHGTDTMAYTASAMTFMLGSIKKPVVLTGSQIPIFIKESDAKNNLINAFRTACESLKGVYIAFNNKIIKGCRASKVRTIGYDAFESINYPLIGEIRNGNIFYTGGINHSSHSSATKIAFNNKYCDDVFLLKLIPGTRPHIFDFIADAGYQAVIIEAFGCGGVPFSGRDLLPEVERLIHQGISVAIATQCLYGGSNLSIYEFGQKTKRSGVIPGYNMTTEALVAKMMWALAQSSRPEKIAEIMATNYHDEVAVLEDPKDNTLESMPWKEVRKRC